MLGMSTNEDIDGWVVIGSGPGRRQGAFQRAAAWTPAVHVRRPRLDY
jgi:hypothetical protein